MLKAFFATVVLSLIFLFDMPLVEAQKGPIRVGFMS